MVNSNLILRCPICVSSDVEKITITLDGKSKEFYHCNECEFEWPVPEESLSSDTDAT